MSTHPSSIPSPPAEFPTPPAKVAKPIRRRKHAHSSSGLTAAEPQVSAAVHDKLKTLLASLDAIPEPRMAGRVVHRLGELLFCALCTLLCGGECYTDMEDFTQAKLSWLRGYIKLTNGVPSHDVFRNVFAAIKPDALHRALSSAWPSSASNIEGQVVSFDGKTLCGSALPSAGLPPLHILRAFVKSSGLTIAYQACGDKGGEAAALDELLENTDVAGSIVTVDAGMGTIEAAKKIQAKGADFLFTIKGNSGGDYKSLEQHSNRLRDALWVINPNANRAPAERIKEVIESIGRSLPPTPLSAQQLESETSAAQAFLKTFKSSHHTKLSHGRYQDQYVYVTTDLSWWPKSWKWEQAGAKTLMIVVRSNHRGGSKDGGPGFEVVHCLTSREGSAEELAKILTDHWGIENSCHYVLDVTFGEDRSQVRDHQAAQNLTQMRDLARFMLKRFSKATVRSKRMRCMWSDIVLANVLAYNFNT